MAIVFRNNATTALASDITNSATSITVTDGSKFPSITGSDYFYCTFDDGTNNEIVKVTAISGNTLTVVRAQDNTTARAFSTGDIAELRLTAAVLETFSQLDEGEITADEFIGDLRGAVIFKAQAGEAVSKGDVVYVSGITGNTPVVSKADADDSAKMPAFGLILTTAALNASTEVVTFGTISGVDTSAFSLGDTLYVSTTAGTLTATKPAGESALIQNIGKVQRAHASAGSIKVGGAGRTNDVPNLNDGNIFIGNGSNQSSTASLNTKIEEYLDGGTSTPTFSTLNVSGNTTLTGDLTVNGTTTSLNTNTLDVEDKNITLNYSTGDSSASADGSGITIQDAVNSTTDATILWDATNDRFDFSHGVTFPDNKKAIFGTGGDLEIYHDGSNSYIKDVGTGNLWIGGVNVHLGNPTASEYYIQTISNGAVTLYYDNSAKLATTSSGIDVTGTTVTDGLTVNSGDTSSFLTIRNGSNSSFTKLYSDLNGVTVLDVDANNVGSSPRFQIDVSEVQALRITEGGDISFYDDTGTTQGLFWDASTERLGIGTTSPSELLHIYNTGGAGNDANVLIEADGPGVNAKLTIDGHVNGGQLDLTYRSNTQSKTVAMKCLNDGSFRIDTLGSEAMRIVGNDVGIGTDAPIAKLHVESANNYNGTNFESNPHLAIDNGTPTNHTAVLMFESSGTDASNKRSGITGGNYYSNKHGLGFFGDLASKDRSATPDMFVNSSGNVGIGTSSVSSNSKLHINDSSTSDSQYTLHLESYAPTIVFEDVSGGTQDFSIQANTNALTFSVGDATTGTKLANEKLRLTSAGNFGIGTTSPSEKLTIDAGNIALDDNRYITWGSNTGRVKISGNESLDDIRFNTDNSERMRLTNTGLGIGTSSPSELLHLAGSSDTVKGLIHNNSTSTSAYATLGFQSDYSHSVNPGLFLTGSNNTNYAGANSLNMYQFGNFPLGFVTNNTLKMIIKGNGNVGIGTDNPVVTLNVDSDAQNEIARFQGANAQLRIDNNTLNVINLNSGGSGDALALSTGGSEAIRIEDNQNVGIGTTAPAEKLSIQDGDIIVQNDTKVTFGYRGTSASSALAFRDRFVGVDRVTISATGNVGIGTTSPSEALSVSGNAELGSANNLYLNNGGYDGVGTHAAIRWFSTGSAKRKAADIITAQADSFARSDLLFRTQSGTANADPTEVMRITHDNRVGIGTTSPSSVLEIADSGVELKITDTRNQSFTVGDIITTLGFYSDDASGSSGAANNLPRGAIDMVTASTFGSAHDMVFRTRADTSATASEKLRITSSGNVGIAGATTIDDGNLQIGDSDADFNIAVAGARSKFGYDSSNNSAVVQGGVTKGIIFCVNNNTLGSGEVGRFDSSGNFGIGTTPLFGHKFSVQASTDKNFTVDDNNGTGISLNAYNNSGSNVELAIKSNIFSVHSATAERFRITNAGNVGIGTTAPDYALDVRDDANIQLKLASTTATNNARMVFAPNNVIKWNVGVNYNDNELSFYDQTTATTPVRFEQGAANNTLVVDSNSRVGIGTNAPTSTLTVNGTINGVAIKANETDFTGSILISDDGATGTLSSATSNTGLGSLVLANLTSGDSNVAVGRQALNSLTTGSNNTAVGRNALLNSTANNNTAVGYSALSDNTTGQFNTAIGRDALANNTTANNNTAVGYRAALNVTTGERITAIGYGAADAVTDAASVTAVGWNCLGNANSTATGTGAYCLSALTTGTSNAAFGYYAMNATTTGANNAAFGDAAMQQNTTGIGNVAVGRQALQDNTTGNNITAVGFNALKNNETGNNNVGIGYKALFDNIDGDANVAIGHDALENVTASDNTAIGKSAGDSITTGSNNTCIGYQSDTASATSTNSVTLGDANITTLRCNTQTISALSDARDKSNVEDLQLGVEFIKDLRPVSFTWDRRDGSQNGVEDFGFIAQELDAVQEKHNEAERLGLVLKDNPDKLEASYGKLVPMLVKAIQEQQEQIEELKQKL